MYCNNYTTVLTFSYTTYCYCATCAPAIKSQWRLWLFGLGWTPIFKTISRVYIYWYTRPMYRPHGTHLMYRPMVHTYHMLQTPCTDPMVHTPHVTHPMYRPHGTHTPCTDPFVHTSHVHNPWYTPHGTHIPCTDPMVHTTYVQTPW